MTDVAASVSMGITPYAFSANGDAVIQRYAPTCRTLTPSGVMRRVWDLVDKIAPTSSAVLVRGESGVGKETIAREIHRKSSRANRALVRLACGAICEDQLDAQLFGRDGYRASAGEPLPPSGLLGRSDHGTLFLKGISELPSWAQIKLLDVLQQGEYPQPATVLPGTIQRMVVPDGPAPLDVRVIATATCDLEAAVAEGRFHSGLYYYVNIVELRVPPLRERRRTSERWPSASCCGWARRRVRGWAAGPGTIRRMVAKVGRGDSRKRHGSGSCSTTGPATPASWPAWWPMP